MQAVVVGVSAPKVDKKQRTYWSVEVKARIPCWNKELAEKLLPNRRYNFILLSKHDFVELTDAELIERPGESYG